MARAYKEKRPPDAKPRVLKLYCASCEEWDEESDWTFHQVYLHDEGSRYEFFDNDSDFVFGEACKEVEAYEHDSCSEWFLYPEKDEEGHKDIWVCGNCGYRTYEQDKARRCCT
jgi:hypothetical protein